MSSLLKFALLQPLEQMISLYLSHDPQILRTLNTAGGDRTIQLTCTSAPAFSLGLRITPDRLVLLSQTEDPADATLCGSRNALLGLLLSDDPATALYHPELALSGDVHLIQRLHRAITGLELDWADLFDNSAWHLASSALKRSGALLNHNLLSLQLNTTDFLQQESAWLPAPAEITHFSERLAALRLRIDRAQARLQQLTPSMPGAGTPGAGTPDTGIAAP